MLVGGGGRGEGKGGKGKGKGECDDGLEYIGFLRMRRALTRSSLDGKDCEDENRGWMDGVMFGRYNQCQYMYTERRHACCLGGVSLAEIIRCF